MPYEKYQIITAESILLIIGVFLFIRSWVVCTKDFDSRINNIPDEWVRNRCRNTEKIHKYFALVGLGLGLVLSMISLFYLFHTSFFTVPTQTKGLFYIDFIFGLSYFFAIIFTIFNFIVNGLSFKYYNKNVLSYYKENNFMPLDEWDKGKLDNMKKENFISWESSRYSGIGWQWNLYITVSLYYLIILLSIIYLCTIKTAYNYIFTICSLIFN
ncbi:MAG: hypothetical protein IJ187_04445 [Neisseriaceae bacterium]|nr:hypothetical protein [Neisseriaceae bacterium]